MENRHKAEKTYFAQNAKAIALLFMENRHKAQKTYFDQNAKAIALLSHQSVKINDKRLMLIKIERL